MAEQSGASGDQRAFEAVDWRAIDPGGRILEIRTVVFLLSSLGLAGSFMYDYLFVPNAHTLVGAFRPRPLEWLVGVALVFLVAYGLVPALQNPSRFGAVWRDVRRRRFGVASTLFLGVMTVLALVAPDLLGPPDSARLPFTGPQIKPPTSALPPPFLGGVPLDTTLYCSGTARNGMCYGTIAHPLGTTPSGRDVLAYVFGGFRVAMEVAVLTSVLLVPVATVAGTTAAYLGGRVDAVVMRAADFLQVVPVFVIYLFVRLLVGAELWVLVILFGLLGWGRIARRVRAEALSLRDAGYVRAARDAGATPVDTVRRHLIPNVSHVAIGALALQAPKLILAEVTLSYLGLVQLETPTWGFIIAAATDNPTLPVRTIEGISPLRVWWSFVFPTLAVIATTAAIAVLAEALGEALDPREGDQQ